MDCRSESIFGRSITIDLLRMESVIWKFYIIFKWPLPPNNFHNLQNPQKNIAKLTHFRYLQNQKNTIFPNVSKIFIIIVPSDSKTKNRYFLAMLCFR